MPFSRKLLVFVGDCVMLATSFYITLLVRFGGQEHTEARVEAIPFIILYILWILIFYIFDLYDAHRMKFSMFSLPRVLAALLVQSVVGFLLFYFIPAFGIAPKTNLIFNVVIFGILFTLWRRVVWMFSSKNFTKRVALIGNRTELAVLERELRENSHLGYEFCGSFANLREFSVSEVCKKVEVLVASDTLTQTELAECTLLPYELLDIRTAFQTIFYKIPPSLMTEQLAMHVLERRDNSIYRFSMRCIEIVFASVVLIATSWISLIIMLGIKIEDGKQLFIRQERVGKKGKVFTLYKFRSMIAIGKDGQAETGFAIWAQGGNDSRITKIGKITRKLHIDEIPQMINILKGDMALVGPRPERPEFVEKLEKEIPYYFLRQSVKPGFTGWAQIKFRYARNVSDSEQKFAYDLFYLLNKNFFLDIGIILKTVQIIVTHFE